MKGLSKRGDDGQTDLLYGGRIPKSSPRVEAYGTIDEAVSAIGVARALSHDEDIQGTLLRIQREMFIVGAELATEPNEYTNLVRHFGQVTSSMVEGIERTIEAYEEKTVMPKGFVIPGANPVAAHLDLARAIVRRSERRSVELWEQQMLTNQHILSYLNRLSDLLFVLARVEERASTILLKQPPASE